MLYSTRTSCWPVSLEKILLGHLVGCSLLRVTIASTCVPFVKARKLGRRAKWE